MPHNFRQIKNLQYKERQKSRLTHDAIYNLHELAYDLDGFVNNDYYFSWPDCYLWSQQACRWVGLGSADGFKVPSVTILWYNIPTWWFLPFSFPVSTHLLFQQSNHTRSFSYIHKRKFQSVHETLATAVPSLVKGKKNVPFVTDEEIGIK